MAIITTGRIVRTVLPRRERGRELDQRSHEEIEDLRAAVDEVSGRLARLEEERDFYRDLLEAPAEAPKIGPVVPDQGAPDTSGPA